MDSQKGIHTHAHKCTHTSLSFSRCPPPPGTFTHTCTWTCMDKQAHTSGTVPDPEAGRQESICYPHPQDKHLSKTAVSVRLLEFLPGGVHTLSPRKNRERVGGSSHSQGGNHPLSTWACNADEFHIFVRDLFFFRRQGRLSGRPSFWEAD